MYFIQKSVGTGHRPCETDVVICARRESFNHELLDVLHDGPLPDNPLVGDARHLDLEPSDAAVLVGGLPLQVAAGGRQFVGRQGAGRERAGHKVVADRPEKRRFFINKLILDFLGGIFL